MAVVFTRTLSNIGPGCSFHGIITLVRPGTLCIISLVSGVVLTLLVHNGIDFLALEVVYPVVEPSHRLLLHREKVIDQPGAQPVDAALLIPVLHILF